MPTQSKLDEIFDAFDTDDFFGGRSAISEAKQQIKDLILSKEWYYLDPDEIGEDKFKRLTEDEVSEL